jgi:hypothetical protein
VNQAKLQHNYRIGRRGGTFGTDISISGNNGMESISFYTRVYGATIFLFLRDSQYAKILYYFGNFVE